MRDDGMRALTARIPVDVMDRWDRYVEERKRTTDRLADPLTGQVLVGRAMVEYMDKHPVRKEGK